MNTLRNIVNNNARRIHVRVESWGGKPNSGIALEVDVAGKVVGETIILYGSDQRYPGRGVDGAIGLVKAPSRAFPFVTAREPIAGDILTGDLRLNGQRRPKLTRWAFRDDIEQAPPGNYS